MAVQNIDEIKSVILLGVRLQNLCEGFDETNKSAVITSKIKILLTIAAHGHASPTVIKNGACLAKSNVTYICNQLLSDGYITKTKDTFDTREITYALTEKGEEHLNVFLSKAKKNFEGEIAYKNNMKEINQAVEHLLDLIG